MARFIQGLIYSQVIYCQLYKFTLFTITIGYVDIKYRCGKCGMSYHDDIQMESEWNELIAQK